ncbi:MAG: 50S ribosomal protein L32 [Cyanobacteria bacterium P01_H01_bin.74]
MPVPKKRVGRPDQGHRRSTWKATIPSMTSCPNCGELNYSHTLCPSCGYYKGRIVSNKLYAKFQA